MARRRRQIIPPPTQIVTPAQGTAKELEPLTFGSFLPEKFQPKSPVHAEENVSSKAQLKETVEDCDNQAIRKLQFSDVAVDDQPQPQNQPTMAEIVRGKHNMGNQIFILPKKVVKSIEAICRSFLWTGNGIVSKRSLIAWDKVCRPVTAGGLNIIDIQTWNKAAVSKLLWDLARKKDCLWIKWIHFYYIKNDDIETMASPKNASWISRKIIDCRTQIMNTHSLQGDLISRLQQVCKAGKFQIHILYLSLLPDFPKMDWRNLMATPNVLPRHLFTIWMAAHGRLPTVDRLLQFGIQVDAACVFCNHHIEDFEHLFFDCSVTNRIWSKICHWLGYHRRPVCWKSELTWICSNARSKQFKKAVIATAFATTVSLIWRGRNAIRFQKQPFDDNKLCREIAILIHARGRRCKTWLKGLRQLNYYP